MVQIIKRVEGRRPIKESLGNDLNDVQVSFNSDGHLCIRIIIGNGEDILIVLNIKASRKVMDFVKKICGKQVIICENHKVEVNDDLPF
jgi:hypothetical protein